MEFHLSKTTHYTLFCGGFYTQTILAFPASIYPFWSRIRHDLAVCLRAFLLMLSSNILRLSGASWAAANFSFRTTQPFGADIPPFSPTNSALTINPATLSTDLCRDF